MSTISAQQSHDAAGKIKVPHQRERETERDREKERERERERGRERNREGMSSS